jgi:hypothetical protein
MSEDSHTGRYRSAEEVAREQRISQKWELRQLLPHQRHGEKEQELLGDGWEPFAVSDGTLYLRREKS